ncbi:MAG: DUF3570 domain-containing protein [Flavobacteriales bacterium]
MKKFVLSSCLFLFFAVSLIAQKDSTLVYKKKVLDNVEVDFLSSYYTQDGDNASVTGGIGTEKLTDITPTIVIAYPLNDDDVLTLDAGISTYTSASSSNLDPFDKSGASSNGEEEDEDDDRMIASDIEGSPWVASSGASSGDVWINGSLAYTHSSDNRNTILKTHVSVASEFDYFSIGFGGSLTKLFNDKNTEIGLSTQVYLDTWNPRYPTELDSYLEAGGSLNNGFFNGITIYNQEGNAINNSGNDKWNPEAFNLIKDKGRNSYSASVSFSQILSKKAQISIFFDAVLQKGWLSNPMQRVYFADKANYYIGNPESIPFYTSSKNKNVFHLADDIEQLPNSRFKLPLGIRFNYYINEIVTIRTYYRYYFDDWGINAHTANIELPIKISEKFTLYPQYRYYQQTATDYFAPYDQHLSTDEFYTSDYDLSKFDAHQFGLGISYQDIFTKMHIWRFGLKNIDFTFNQYARSTGLNASIFSLATKFILQ